MPITNRDKLSKSLSIDDIVLRLRSDKLSGSITQIDIRKWTRWNLSGTLVTEDGTYFFDAEQYNANSPVEFCLNPVSYPAPHPLHIYANEGSWEQVRELIVNFDSELRRRNYGRTSFTNTSRTRDMREYDMTAPSAPQIAMYSAWVKVPKCGDEERIVMVSANSHDEAVHIFKNDYVKEAVVDNVNKVANHEVPRMICPDRKAHIPQRS